MARRFKRFLAGFALLCASAATAETLPVSGVYPAGNDAAAALGTIAVERFGGVDGQQLSIAVADKLRAVAIDGEPYFRIVPSRSSAETDAVLQGTAGGEASRRDSGTRETGVDGSCRRCGAPRLTSCACMSADPERPGNARSG